MNCWHLTFPKSFKPVSSGGGEDTGLFALALPVGLFAAARVGLLWEEREPTLFVYFLDLLIRFLIRPPSMFWRIVVYRNDGCRFRRAGGHSSSRESTTFGPFEGLLTQNSRE